MASTPIVASGVRGRRRPLLRVCALLAALAVTGCGSGGLPSSAGTQGSRPPVESAPPAPGGSEAQGLPPASTGPAPTPPPTEQPGPPVATLVVAAGVPMAGMLGSYVWAGTGSDSPWIVPPPERAIRARAPYGVTLTPPLEVARWEAAWARVDGDTAGDPGGSASGDGGPVAVPGPAAVGTWSLVVDIRFADGNNAAWFWRVEVLP